MSQYSRNREAAQAGLYRKLHTPVEAEGNGFTVSLSDRILVLGSCFADNMGSRLLSAGFRVCVNPFGTLYNPASTAAALERLDSPTPFSEEECVEMGSGAGLVCSHSHHTRFARKTAAEFLQNANESLSGASEFWKECNKVIITFGTAAVWRRDGKVVANCLKRPQTEFTRELLTTEEIAGCIARILRTGRECLFTVSPIRHLGAGARDNTISKSILHIALAESGAPYFPSYEIMLDELRDYRFYADDLCHPSQAGEEVIWQRFVEWAVPRSELDAVRENEKAARRAAHRSINV